MGCSNGFTRSLKIFITNQLTFMEISSHLPIIIFGLIISFAPLAKLFSSIERSLQLMIVAPSVTANQTFFRNSRLGAPATGTAAFGSFFAHRFLSSGKTQTSKDSSFRKSRVAIRTWHCKIASTIFSRVRRVFIGISTRFVTKSDGQLRKNLCWSPSASQQNCANCTN